MQPRCRMHLHDEHRVAVGASAPATRLVGAREVALGDASAELAAFNGPTPPGVAVITDFAA